MKTRSSAAVLSPLRLPLVAVALITLTVSLGFPPGAPAFAAGFTVDSTGDGSDADVADGVCDDGSGYCTLRAAIEQANASPGLDIIGFDPEGAGPHVILPGRALPEITGPVVIDGTTAPIFTGAPVIELNGANAGTNADGLRLEHGADGNVVRGLTILNFGGAGIFTYSDSLIEGNVVSANERGIYVDHVRNIIRGNLIGTDVTGSFDLGNLIDGVELGTESANNNLVEGNVVSGNGADGVEVDGRVGNVLRGNLIGTDASGTYAIPNDAWGISVDDARESFLIEDNVVSGNRSDGIRSGGRQAVIRGNFIGTDAAGTAALPNGGSGILLRGFAMRHAIGPDASNVIAYNLGDGVRIDSRDASQDTIRGNSIFSNGGKGIELERGGNFELESPVTAGLGPAFGTACSDCTVDVYSDGEDEGRVWHGSTLADGSGDWVFAGEVLGPNVTATATDSDGNTSEFSEPLAVPAPAPSVTPTLVATPTATAPPGATATSVPSPTPVALGVSQLPATGGGPRAATGAAVVSILIAGTAAIGSAILLALAAERRRRRSNRH